MSLGMNPKTPPPWILAGWLLSATLIWPHKPGALPARVGPETPKIELLERGSVRELCLIPVLGARRAQSLVSSRGPEGLLPPLDDIPGIGPQTAEALRSFCGLGLGVPSDAGPRRQRLSTTHSRQRAAEPTRVEALELREELRGDS